MHEKKCPICNKWFIPAPFHIYTEPTGKKRKVCSYHCCLEAERRHRQMLYERKLERMRMKGADNEQREAE